MAAYIPNSPGRNPFLHCSTSYEVRKCYFLHLQTWGWCVWQLPTTPIALFFLLHLKLPTPLKGVPLLCFIEPGCQILFLARVMADTGRFKKINSFYGFLLFVFLCSFVVLCFISYMWVKSYVVVVFLFLLFLIYFT